MKRREDSMQQERNFKETRVLFYVVEASILKETVEIFFLPQIFRIFIDKGKTPPSIQILKMKISTF